MDKIMHIAEACKVEWPGHGNEVGDISGRIVLKRLQHKSPEDQEASVDYALNALRSVVLKALRG